MFVDQLGGIWLSGPLALAVMLGALALVLWADGGLRMPRRRPPTRARGAPGHPLGSGSPGGGRRRPRVLAGPRLSRVRRGRVASSP